MEVVTHKPWRGRSLAAVLATAIALGTALVVLGAKPAGAQSISDLQAQIASAQAEAESLSAELAATTQELAAARDEAAAAAARELELTALLAAGEEREAELEVEVAEARDRLREARARLRRALQVLADRLVAIYKGNAPTTTELLLTADGYDDLTTRAELLERIHEADESLAERVHALREAVERRLEAVEEARDEQAAYNDQVAAARDEIAAVRANAEARAAALEQASASQAAAVESLRSQVGTWVAQVEELQAAQAAAAAEAAAEAAAAEEAAAEEAAAEEAAAEEAAVDEVASWTDDWAIPSAIVECESGGNWSAVNPSSGAGGAYQILPSTWELYGGSGAPQDASPAEQSQIAAQIWADSGAAAWECAG
jgi:peptidoglycan hydrolase CwlO-like protein